MKTIKIYSYGIDINTLEIDIASWDASLLDNNIAVSYTHLDVYKRQIIGL